MNCAGRSSRRAIGRFSAFVLALSWCVCPALAALHASLELHRYCPEHGALEEIDGGAGAPNDRVLDGATPTLEGASAARAHEECAFDRCCRPGQVAAEIPVHVRHLDAWLIAAFPRTEAAFPVAPIVFAPKTSPPA
jgi:hypothetical protein